jgi:hypothetical protein
VKARTFFLISAAAVTLLAYLGYQFRVALQQEEQLAALRRRAAQLSAESAALRREREMLTRDLVDAERQFAALPPAHAATPPESPERQAEMNTWLARVKQMRRLFDEHPEQRIPEMQFLTDQDWLRAAKRIDLNAEDGARKAFAAIRDIAATRFTPQLSSALRKFRDSSPGATPPSIAALTSFFEAPPDRAMLDRYELQQVTESYDPAPRWRVQTKAPIDADYDGRHYVDAYVDGRGHGGGSLGAPWAWVPKFREQSELAYKSYAAANKGTSAAGLADVLPYFNPPLAPALAEKLIKAEREQKR